MKSLIKRWIKRYDARRRVTGHHEFQSRQSHHSTLVMVLAGHKPELWQAVSKRLKTHLPKNCDVCIISAGVKSAHISAQCADLQWSYLHTKTPCPNLAMNLAITYHSAADDILKIDEDIFIGHNFLEGLFQIRTHALSVNRHRVGAVAPLLNVNGFSYRLLLEELNVLDAYQAEFGKAYQACGGIPAFEDGEAAKWLWNNSLPFDHMVERVSKRPLGYHIVPHRFSIGAILFTRSFWQKMGHFKVPYGGAVLGVDEVQFCHHCFNSAQHLIVANNVFAGHWSFGPQAEVMNEHSKHLLPHLDVK